MTKIKLRHIDRFRDRHGRVRYYYRVGRGKRIPLPGRPGDLDFMAAYSQAASGTVVAQCAAKRGAPGTFDRLVQDYFSSPDYLRLAASTRKTYRSVIERLVTDENIGHRLISEMTRELAQRMIAKRAATPGAANSALQKLRVLINFAIDRGWREDDPTDRIKKFKGAEHHTWSEDELRQFEQRWPIGSTPRLAFALLLFTGQRLSDVVRMEWSDLSEGTIAVTPSKTAHTTGTKLWIPIHADLADVLIAHIGARSGTILKSAYGKPFSAAGFGNGMADKIAAAGLPDRCVTHGLRKAAARRLAEAGCSAREIMAVTGHASLAEVERYTRAAEQKRLARAAIERLKAQDARTKSQPSEGGSGHRAKLANKSTSPETGWWSRGESNP